MNKQALYNLPSSREQELESVKREFHNNLYKEFKMDKLNHKLEHWYMLDWPDFRKELLKAGERLTYRMQLTWEAYFNDKKEKALRLLQDI